MEQYERYAIYYAPPAGAFADRAAEWLGRDSAGADVAQPALDGLPLALADLTATPRRYGFHGTIKPPFALARGQSAAALAAAVATLAADLGAVQMPRLELRRIGGFLALTPTGDTAALLALGAAVVETLDPFRAPLTAQDRARRRPERLSARQVALLDRWGYPHVMEEFRFHLTLTGDLSQGMAEAVRPVAQGWFDGVLPEPFRIGDLCLFGETADKRFQLVHRYALTG